MLVPLEKTVCFLLMVSLVQLLNHHCAEYRGFSLQKASSPPRCFAQLSAMGQAAAASLHDGTVRVWTAPAVRLPRAPAVVGLGEVPENVGVQRHINRNEIFVNLITPK